MAGWLGRRSRTSDSPVRLTVGQRQRGLADARCAGRAARSALRSSAKAHYRRYRATAGDAYLTWPEWHAEFQRVLHKRSGVTTIPDTAGQWGGMPPGSVGMNPL